MARINPVIVRLDDDQRVFLEKMAKKDVQLLEKLVAGKLDFQVPYDSCK